MSKGIREAPGKALIGDLAREAGDRTEGAFSECLPCMHVQHAMVRDRLPHQTLREGYPVQLDKLKYAFGGCLKRGRNGEVLKRGGNGEI